jgi:hypothetical protein
MGSIWRMSHSMNDQVGDRRRIGHAPLLPFADNFGDEAAVNLAE